MSRRTAILSAIMLICSAVALAYLLSSAARSSDSSLPTAESEDGRASSTEHASNAVATKRSISDACRHPFLPLAVGTRWRYRGQASPATGVEALYVDREVTSLDHSGTEFIATVRTSLSATGQPGATSHETRVSCALDGAVDDVLDDLGEDTMFSLAGSAPRLPRDLSIGTSFERMSNVVLRLPMLGPNAARVHVEISGVNRVVRHERIETPVGSRDAWVIERRDEFTLRPDPEIVALAQQEGTPFPEMPSRTVRAYLAEGIGLVRRETVQAGHRVEWTLERFTPGR